MTKPLVVIQILPALNNGGVERGTVEMANYLSLQGHTSIVISAGGKMQKLLSDSVEHICLSVGKKSVFSLFNIKKLSRIFIDKKADIIHVRSRLPAWFAYRAIAKIRHNKPKFISTIHGLYSVKRYSSIMARADRVIAVSKTALAYVKTNYPCYLTSDPELIYRGINVSEFPYAYKPDETWIKEFYAKYPQLLGHKIVLLAGRLTSLKGAKSLLTWLKTSENNAKLVLTANLDKDFYAVKLFHYFKENGIEDRIIWIDQTAKMAELYAISDVVVSTSIRPESFGRTVLEALAIGTPVVGYNHGGVEEILDQIFPQGKVELNNYQELSDKINQFLKNKPIVPNTQPFKLNLMLENTMKLYQNAIQ